MTEQSVPDRAASRVFEQSQVELWSNGPTFAGLLDRFTSACASAAQLKSRPSLSQANSSAVLAFFFQGATLELADRLVVHRKVATAALIFAAVNNIFPKSTFGETSELIRELPEPQLDGEDPLYAIHRLGASAITEWLDLGIDTPPPTKQFLFFIQLDEEFAVPRDSGRDAAEPLSAVVLPPMGLVDAGKVVADWALGKPTICRVLFFGSRVRSEERPGSDLDIAVELNVQDLNTALGHWIFDHAPWHAELQELLPWPVDLQLFQQGGTPTVAAGLERSSTTILDRRSP